MVEMTFEQILQAAQKLNPQQKALLAQSLQTPAPSMGPTRADLIAELEALRAAGAFANVESLRNRYAKPALADLTAAQLSEDIREASAEWEKELDGLPPI